MNIIGSAMKVILLTGSTDGIGLEAARQLLEKGHKVLLHGRNPTKLQKVAAELGIQ
jgi:short-subunit dehydrogenase